VVEPERFDIFVSYNRNDSVVVDKFVLALRSRGLNVFRDIDSLAIGQEWPPLLEKCLAACRAVAICIGPTGLGLWQTREQYVALDRQAREPDFPHDLLCCSLFLLEPDTVERVPQRNRF